MQHADFDDIMEIGAGGYGTVYTAKYKGTARYKRFAKVMNMPKTVVLKRFKSFDETPELFISEVSSNL